ncbi:hypothetical protein [Nocardiopsis valliformis]|uniref:hypothetical protein n=1 Tax=Nocardiopsis valliformis TaxID=239974 RepID=UPI000475B01F|nr:hypothetical protein [Nocardiopsis valliformis]
MAISPEHQIYSELFADAPDMAVGFLRDLGVKVPDYDRSELTSCDLGHVDPVERRSDVTIMLRGKVHEDPLGKLMGIVVEVQRDDKERKRFTWPEYVAAMRSKHECPVTLLVICPRQNVADAYNAPIPLGHPGFVLHPLVLGLERIPVITDPAEVGRHPTLGVLSAAAHGPADPDVVKALHTGLDSIDQEMATKYIGYALHLLTDSNGQRALEELMMTETYEYTSAWTESLKAEGRTEGKAEGEANMLLLMLEVQDIEVTEEARERILGCTDSTQLKTWAIRSKNITRIDELFED